MTHSDELLSALLDGECKPSELDALLRGCAESAPLIQRFERLCLVREVLRGGAVHVDTGFCARVMSQVSPPPVRHIRMPWHRRRQVRPAIGLALAASLGALVTVAVLRVGALPQWRQVPGQAAVTPVPLAVAAASSVPLLAQPASVADRAGAALGGPAVAEVRWDQLQPETARQLDDLLMEHSTYRAGEGMGGTLSYARAAAHGINYQPDSGSPP
ncbi:MAG: sigma-E factor negative regulatory protein [Gammaproteobacteria bacterium]|nr:sigma-E factor negative regulatory protein [Gammaproteobacteria bacterium]